MPGFSGVDFVKTLKDSPNIVLTTSDINFAIEAYEYDCIVDYLVKPITQERFEKCIAKISSLTTKPSRVKSENKQDSLEGKDLYINIDRRLVKLKLNEILVIEANDLLPYLGTGHN